MDLTVGQIVWARRHKDDIYWPAKIIIISNNTNDLWSSEIQSNYFIQFFVTNQSIWITDILPYRQYRDSMANDSFIHYGLHPTIKHDFLNAIQQADYACTHEIYNNSNDLTIMTTEQQKLVPIIDDNNDNDFLLTPAPVRTSNKEYDNPSNTTIQSLDTFSSNNNRISINNDWYTQQGLIVESITPPLPTTQNDTQSEYISSLNNIQQINSILIITTKSYSNSSFISYIFNCFSTFLHHSIIYIDDIPSHFQHPNTTNISYLICLDNFNSIIQQQLDSTILNNLNAHINYLFLILNSSSNELIKHFYSRIMNKKIIIILHYHLTFDNEPLLLCSGNRLTFEMIQMNLLKYLCSKIKYIESTGDEDDEQLYSAYCISSIVQTTNILNNFINEQIQENLNENFDLDFLRNNQNILNELFPNLTIKKSSNQNNLLDFIQNSNEDILKNKSKQSTIMNNLFENGIIKTHIPPPICEYYIQNILHEN